MKTNKIKNNMIFLLFTLIFTCLLSFNVFAKKSDSNYIKIDKISTSIDYDLDDIIIKKTNIENGVVVDIYDKNYNLLESIEEIDLTNGISLYSCGEQYTRLVTRSFYEGPVRLTISAECTIYDECSSSGGLNSHILRVTNPEIYISNSSYSSLEYSRTLILNNTSIQGIGVITTIIDKHIGGDFSIDIFKSAGFSVTGQVGTTFYLRKDFNKIVDFR